jgi:hypothetical protein
VSQTFVLAALTYSLFLNVHNILLSHFHFRFESFSRQFSENMGNCFSSESDFDDLSESNDFSDNQEDSEKMHATVEKVVRDRFPSFQQKSMIRWIKSRTETSCETQIHRMCDGIIIAWMRGHWTKIKQARHELRQRLPTYVEALESLKRSNERKTCIQAQVLARQALSSSPQLAIEIADLTREALECVDTTSEAEIKRAREIVTQLEDSVAKHNQLIAYTLHPQFRSNSKSLPCKINSQANIPDVYFELFRA